jgi:hypothetical protein
MTTLISKNEIINEILESGAKYVKTSVSNEACAVDIAIRDIECIDDLPNNLWWSCESYGLNEDDY